MIHVDIMDGHFVPNLTIGPAVLRSLAPAVHERDGLFSVHLMLDDPGSFLAPFVTAGADALSVHVEAGPHLYRTLTAIKDLGAAAGVALNPGTPVSAVDEVLELVDFLLVMTVNPGFGGQAFVENGLERIARARAMADGAGRQILIEVDGGVKLDNIRAVADAGADVIVAGSAVFGAPDPAAAIADFRKALTS
jgi:ribulose-phosphate 3-epimerase